ncbi:MAG: outer membrane lipid asymmetry maintenance protein MlaD [Lysobacterales bacterium CG02_land_8_20_14_3_00_62_12]|nr:MAG: outer membrane lipid asymmetry maintenance protein MlaD [Xanthomonadales bacterium CG02_land_8_20_14_3_00_62_12]
MKASQARLDIAVGLFLLLAFATLMVLAFASTNGRMPMSGDYFQVKARFANIGELRLRAPVKIGGVTIGKVSAVVMDPTTYEAIVSLDIQKSVAIPADSSAGIFTAGMLGDRYIGITPGGDTEMLAGGDEVMLTQSAIVLEQLISKFIFGGGRKDDKDDNNRKDPL